MIFLSPRILGTASYRDGPQGGAYIHTKKRREGEAQKAELEIGGEINMI